MSSSGMTAEQLLHVSAERKGENLGNTNDVECFWAIKAGEHAEIYFNLISSVDPSCLRLTPIDDEIYTKFRQTFPDMRVDVIDEDKMKSGSGKLTWHNFIEDFKDTVDNYTFGTLIRLDSSKPYTEENSTFCVRTQFLAIEIARNRENHNSHFRFSPESQKDSGDVKTS
ncbi:protein PBDC1-like [Babylonia areolata]|uniref:protein PBDC1-like n=1 Tax=Babylonia areolata TaxID=304850 RepID=UPI003FD5A172